MVLLARSRMPPSPTHHTPTDTVPMRRLRRAPAPRRRRLCAALHRHLATVRRFLLRMDVSWTAVYFLVLLCVAVPIVAVTQVYVTSALVGSWRAVHGARVFYITERISISTTSVHDIANGFMALNIPSRTNYSRYSLMAHLCASLDNYDKMTRFRSLLFISIETGHGAGCIHGIPSMDSIRTLTGFVSRNDIVNGSYLIDNNTYDFVQPMQMITKWPAPTHNITGATRALYYATPLFQLLPAYLNGSIDSVDLRHFWVLPPPMPHLICYTLPLGYIMRGKGDIGSAFYTDFAQVRLDGSRMLLDYDFVEAPGFAVAVFINQSLTDADPLVMSNSWGQQSVSNDSIYAISTTTVTYLKSSNISHALMRAALRHVDLRVLQREGSNQTVEFEYDGALAIVTAYGYTTVQGLVVPIVLVSSHAAVTLPYMHLMRVLNGVLAAVVVALTAAFFCGVRCLLSLPLRHMTALMLASRRVGRRALATRAGTVLVRLVEVHQLARVLAAALRQLREIDTFVPEQLRGARPSDFGGSITSHPASTSEYSCGPRTHDRNSRGLATHVSTAVYISIRPAAAPRNSHSVVPILAPTAPPAPTLREGEKPRRGQRLVTVVEHTAQEANTANSGPFAGPESLAAFVVAVQELCRTHHGTVHRLCPDACVLHFNSAVRAHLPATAAPAPAPAAVAPPPPTPAPATRHGVPAARSAPSPPPPPEAAPAAGAAAAAEEEAQQQQLRQQAADTQRHAARDARNAAAFALALASWVDAQGSSSGGTGGDGDAGRSSSASPAAAAAMPDVRALLDTSVFTCGQYRPAGSEQTLQVALGRDVQRELGRVPQRIGVRVAMTEETAVLLRGAADAEAEVEPDVDVDGGGRRHAAAVCDAGDAVRQLPVDVLRTGRAGLDECTVVLYEALPGRVAGDAAWQCYARCCFDGFAHMLRGDYAGALAAYRGVADIADLEPGLLPAGMRREAAASAVTGGAASVQVARLVRECEQRVRQRVVEPLCRVRAAPPGMCGAGGSAVPARVVGAAASMSDPLSPLPPHSGRGTSRTRSGRVSTAYPAVCERHVVDLAEDSVAVRCVVPSVPLWIQDNFGQQWHLASRDTDHAAVHMNSRRTRALGSAGAMAAAYYAAYRDVHPVVAKAIRDAPAGRMSDALRSATPVCGPTAGQAATMRALFEARQCLQHPNLVPVLGYSESLEGGVVVIWQFCPGGSLRQLQCRYPTLQPISVARFALQISSALAYLHDRGVVHGNLHLDDVMVNADGSCRLAGYEADYAATRRLFKTHRTCYLSPAMAAGALPTTSCDMFCYGLLTLELLTRQPCWRWVLGEAGQPLGSADALRELMRGGGRAFSDALAQGRVVVNVEALAPLPASAATAVHGAALLRDLLSPDPAQRPSAAAVRELSKAALATFGLVVEEDTWRQNAQGVSEG